PGRGGDVHGPRDGGGGGGGWVGGRCVGRDGDRPLGVGDEVGGQSHHRRYQRGCSQHRGGLAADPTQPALSHHFLEAIGGVEAAGFRLEVEADPFFGVHRGSCKLWRSSFMTRWRRLLAVPTGMPRAWAISSYDQSMRWRSTTSERAS